MPMPEETEPEEPQPNAGLLEFINRRRLHQARQRRQRLLAAAMAALALIAVALAVSNVLLIRRLAWRAETPPPARVAPPAPVASAPARPPEPAAPAPAPSPAVEAPPTPPAPAPPAAENDSARRTARWLVQTHGRLEAENRAAKVAEFYRGEEGAFWRRVLLNVRREPAR